MTTDNTTAPDDHTHAVIARLRSTRVAEPTFKISISETVEAARRASSVRHRVIVLGVAASAVAIAAAITVGPQLASKTGSQDVATQAAVPTKHSVIGTGGSSHSGHAPAPPSAMQQSWTGFVVCQEAIVEGDVVKVEPAGRKDYQLITMKVLAWLKPTEGPTTTELEILDPTYVPPNTVTPVKHSPLAEGEHVLIAAPRDKENFERASIWRNQEMIRQTRKDIEDAPKSQTNECFPVN